MRDSAIYKLVENSCAVVRTELRMRFGMVEGLAKEVTYRVSAMLSIVASIPVFGKWYLNLLNKRVKMFEAMVKQQAEEQMRRQLQAKGEVKDDEKVHDS